MSAAAPVPFPLPSEPERDPNRRAELKARVDVLGPWRQGPFPLGEDLVAGGSGVDERRWELLRPHVERLAKSRVLVVGADAGYDAFAFAGMGAGHVLACEGSDAFEQAAFLESLYRSGVEFRRTAWDALDPAHVGTFDLVHCNDLLHRVLEPVALLRKLRSMVADDGVAVIGCLVHTDPERSEYLRFMPNGSTESWWFVPGRLAFRWLVETAGFAVHAELCELEGPRGGMPIANLYLRANPEVADPSLARERLTSITTPVQPGSSAVQFPRQTAE